MEDWENRVRDIAEKAASRDGILPFLRVHVENRNLSISNLLLVFEQNPKAKTVCGRRAWVQVGRTVKADANPIQVILPDISSGQEEGYCVVKVYDYDSTEGKKCKGRQKQVFFLRTESHSLPEPRGSLFRRMQWKNAWKEDFIRKKTMCFIYQMHVRKNNMSRSS